MEPDDPWQKIAILTHSQRTNKLLLLKQRCEDLALEFAENAGKERDLDITASPLAVIKAKPDSANSAPHK